jgi:Leucine-rich repeat (LRR) protein
VERERFETGLRELDFSGNKLTNLTDKTFSIWNVLDLHSLNLSNNNIEVLERYVFYGVTHLQDLDLSRNNIFSIDGETFYFTSNLTLLLLANNRLSEIKATAFSKLNRLQRLDISNNEIASVQAKLFQNNINLEWLSLADNRLTEINPLTFQKQSYLSYLDLSRNEITRIKGETFSQNVKLKLLLLAGNNISELDLRAFHAESELSYLDISGNKMAEIGNLTFRNLQFLSFSKNLLQRIHPRSFRHCNNLRSLSLSENYISEVSDEAFYGLENLEDLDLSGNNITNISIFILPGVSPQMEVNRTKSDCVTNIKHLTLADNRIRYFNFKEFISLNKSYNISSKFCKLELFDLNGNCLSALDDETVNLLRDWPDPIELSDNPWSCACSDSSVSVYKVLSGNRTLNCETGERSKERGCGHVEDTCHSATSVQATEQHTDLAEEEVDNPNPGTSLEPKPLQATIVIFVIYVVLMLVATIVVLVIICAVGKPEPDKLWWEDKLAKRNYH